MLSRILEPEVMDSAEEAHDYDAMDHANVNERFVDDFLACWPGDGVVLDVGTGTAQIPLGLCRRHPTVRVVGVDLAAHMLRVGAVNVERAQLQGRVQLELRDAKQLPDVADRYDAVISNSIVHHIPEPLPVLAEMVRVLKPGGVLFVRDLLRPQDNVSLQRFVQTYAGDASANQRKMFADSLHAALTLDEVRALATQLGFPADEVQATSDRHWTWSVVK